MSCCTPVRRRTGDVGEAIARAGETIARALADSEGCELHLENTAGAGGTLGRSFGELADLLEAAGGSERLGVCLDSCHLLASGCSTSRTSAGAGNLAQRECTRALGRGRVRSLHLNDSQTPLGSNRDRHANIGAGELGEEGCVAFLLGARHAGAACKVLETPGENREGPSREESALAMKLRERGLAARSKR